jgi:hypothetical protein
MTKSFNDVAAEQSINRCMNPDCGYNMFSEPCPFKSRSECSEGKAFAQRVKRREIDTRYMTALVEGIGRAQKAAREA